MRILCRYKQIRLFVDSPISIDRISPREGVQMFDGHLSEFVAVADVVVPGVVVVVLMLMLLLLVLL